jgi:hypothetical protein
MVFAARLAEGAKGVEAFPPLDSDQRSGIENYLRRFTSGRSDLID